jgi:hypothetical protein
MSFFGTDHLLRRFTRVKAPLGDDVRARSERSCHPDVWPWKGHSLTARSYRITVQGRLSDRFASAFDGMKLEPAGGRTVLVGEGMDQGRLFGVIDRVRDFGLELVSVEEIRS